VNERTDIHRPSAIIPDDYQEVAIWTMNITGFGDSEFMLREREIAKAHMAKTGGQLRHYSNGSCGICGNVMAIYLVLFYHAKSNEYIVVGINCAEKMGISYDAAGMNLFRKRVAEAREAVAGKKKAIALLSDKGLIGAWEIYTAEYPAHLDTCPANGQNKFGDDNGVENPCNCGFEERWKIHSKFEERTIRDITGKLVKYGNISDKQAEFVAKLLQKIQDRPIIEAERQAEKDAAGPVPTGRVKLTGEVLMLKEVDRPTYYYNDSGVDTKVLIKLENGSKVYGKRFANVDRGDKVFFIATVEASKDDPKFGFFKRAALALTDEEVAATKLAKKQAAQDKKLLATVAWG
jgi:hypothetical protein